MTIATDFPLPPSWVLEKLRQGTAIPAHPLALDADGRFNERFQRALTRYYAAAGAGGVAVGVHTTQFEIRDPEIGLFEPVLRTAAETLDHVESSGGGGPKLVRIAGINGPTKQAVAEAELASGLGYHVGLLSLKALKEANNEQLIEHSQAVASVLPVMGFYLQPAVGGRRLDLGFWRRFSQIPNVVGIKMAPFNRYQTLDVVRGVAEAGRAGDIALYTGNDDNIVVDLLTQYDLHAGGKVVSQRIVGGLLGHWAVWTKAAARVHRRCRDVSRGNDPVPQDLLTLNVQVTDMNAAVFDVAHDYAGVIAGVQHVLYGQGLLPSERCLNPREVLSPGQAEELARVRAAYPHLIDDDFVAEHRDAWLR